MIRLDFAPSLVEETVLRASETASPDVRRRFRRERDESYAIQDEEARERGFWEVHSSWFKRLELSDGLLAALEEQPEVPAGVSRCLVMPAVAAKQEGADLHEDRGGTHGSDAGKPALVIKLRPETLLSWQRLLALLRNELLHVADMLDPAFGYRRTVAVDDDPAYEKMVRERYRVLWNTSVDGRLAGRSILPAGGKKVRRREFENTFRMLAADAETHFQRFFHGPRPDHEELFRFALRPEGGSLGRAGSGCTERCPLCRLPTTAFHNHPDALNQTVVEELRCDFPWWHPGLGICRQCADLYGSRCGQRRPVLSQACDG